jgi:hypothetical protein
MPIGDLTRGRSGHTASVLGDGSVLIAGGEGNSGTESTAEKFDPSTMTFSPVVDTLRAGRSEHSASVLPDTTHLLVGGRGPPGW